MMDEVSKSMSNFSSIYSETFPIFLEPPSIDARIVNQYGVFSFMSDPNITIDKWLESANVSCVKIVITENLLWKARDRLDQANINERVLFPGLDGLATWLRRHYTDTRNS